MLRLFAQFPVAPEEVAAAPFRARCTSHLLPALLHRAAPAGEATTLIASSLLAEQELLSPQQLEVCMGCLGLAPPSSNTAQHGWPARALR